MFHSEINNLPDQRMRFIQMWFAPQRHGLSPSVQQKQVEREERADKLLALVSNADSGSLPIASDATAYSCFLQKGRTVSYNLKEGYGG
jgi:redox-sensitive bicupin YhaK (pirin superfamily)